AKRGRDLQVAEAAGEVDGVAAGDLFAVLVDRESAGDVGVCAGWQHDKAAAGVTGLVVRERGQVQAERVPSAGGRGPYQDHAVAGHYHVAARVQRVSVPGLVQALARREDAEAGCLPAFRLPREGGLVLEVQALPQRGWFR